MKETIIHQNINDRDWRAASTIKSTLALMENLSLIRSTHKAGHNHLLGSVLTLVGKTIIHTVC